MPMQPAVGAETVAPTPMVAPVAPALRQVVPQPAGPRAEAWVASPRSARAEDVAEKKRNPQLSQDEQAPEERPWTEAVIGNRVRRRGAPDDTKKIAMTDDMHPEVAAVLQACATTAVADG